MDIKELAQTIRAETESHFADKSYTEDDWIEYYSPRLIAAYCEWREPYAFEYACNNSPPTTVLSKDKKDWADSGSGLWRETKLFTAPPLPAIPDGMVMVQREVTEDGKCVLATPGNYRTYQDQWDALIAAGEVKP